MVRGRGGAAGAAVRRDGRALRARRAAVLGPPATSRTSRHVAVEFVHPVIVGKRALPALAVTRASSSSCWREPDDMVIAFGVEVARRRRRCGIVARPARGTTRSSARSWSRPATTCCGSSCTSSSSTASATVHDTGAASFLYPFLGERETDLEAVVADVRRSILMKAEEIGELRAQTLTEGRETLLAAAEALRGAGRVLALGNGGSATDATDLVADLQRAGRAAIDLTADPAILTAIANDVGVEAIFARQVIAYGRAGDALLALSTSGGSANVIAALAEARRRGLVTIAFVGYDGGRIAAEGLADHVVSRARSTSRASRRRRRAPTTSWSSSCERDHPRQAARGHRGDGDDRHARLRPPRSASSGRTRRRGWCARRRAARSALGRRARALGDGRHLRHRLRAAARADPASRVVGPGLRRAGLDGLRRGGGARAGAHRARLAEGP